MSAAWGREVRRRPGLNDCSFVCMVARIGAGDWEQATFLFAIVWQYGPVLPNQSMAGDEQVMREMWSVFLFFIFIVFLLVIFWGTFLLELVSLFWDEDATFSTECIYSVVDTHSTWFLRGTGLKSRHRGLRVVTHQQSEYSTL